MRTVFIAGVAIAVVWLLASKAIRLLNQPSDWAVAGGYLLLLALVASGVGIGSWLTRRRP